MDFINLVTLISNLLPVLTTILTQVEAVLPPGSTLEQKLALVEKFLTSANSASTNAIADFEKVWPLISQLIQAIDAAKAPATPKS